MRSTLPPVIAIDGASGTGKGAVSQQIAEQLGWKVLDSGVLYRVLAFAAQKYQLPLDNEDILQKLADQLAVQFVAQLSPQPLRVLLEGQEVTQSIRTEQMGNAASKVAAFPKVRQALLARQRAFRELPGLVADGRDMGTVVFPDAFIKIFLTASAEIRAKRRYQQLKDKGIDVNLCDLVEELKVRDKRDSERAYAPLRPAVDAVVIDTDRLTLPEVVEKIMQLVTKRMPLQNGVC